MRSSDTLTIDWEFLEQWEDVDYDRDLATKVSKDKEDTTPFNLGGWHVSDNFVTILNVIIVAVVVIAALAALYVKFGKTGSSRQPLEIPEEDTIFGVDFRKMLEELEKGGDMYQCIRVRYLNLLRQLHDSRRISWELYKTPNQYTYEEKSAEFKALTNIFMKVRYGNYMATSELYDEEKRLYAIILGKERKGGAE